MEIVSRNKSQVVVRDKRGKLWLTRRIKRRHDSRRRRTFSQGWAVRHIPIKRIPEKGDWLFTCAMEPKQFGEWLPKPDSAKKYYPGLTEAQWEELKNDDFVTAEGSHHSKKNCSMTLISDDYAAFFISHRLWELFEINNKDFDLYANAVKKVCEAFKINYEGI